MDRVQYDQISAETQEVEMLSGITLLSGRKSTCPCEQVPRFNELELCYSELYHELWGNDE